MFRGARGRKNTPPEGPENLYWPPVHPWGHVKVHFAKNTPKAYSLGMFTFIESSDFERFRPAYLEDDEFLELQQYLTQNPTAGAVVPGSGGVRKLRWSWAGMGKRGGFRVIYFVQPAPQEIWLLTLYAKSKLDNVPGKVLKKILEAFRDE
jgi:hypothetical protein